MCEPLHVQVLLAPLYAPILEPDLDLGFGESEGGGQVESLGAYHVLLTLEFGFEPLQLLGREDGAHSFGPGLALSTARTIRAAALEGGVAVV